MTQTYNAGATEVLTGLEPVCRRSGMYTDTTHPSRLGQEVIDNSVDETLMGHVEHVNIALHVDQSLEVIDDGRGMPTDVHPEEGVPTVELILCRLHTGGKSSDKNYQFSDDLHGVETSMTDALSKRVEVNVCRDDQVYNIASESGEKVQDLQVVDTCSKRNTGTNVRLQPDGAFFNSPRFSVSRLTHVLKTRAALYSGIEITFKDEINNTERRWYYQDDLNGCLAETVNGLPTLPEKPFIGSFADDTEAVDWALLRLSKDDELLTGSYVSLVPTIQGGTHVNGLHQSLLDAMREFCEYRNILPHGVKLSAENIWDRCTYVPSVKMQDPQFARQTKERLSLRQCAAFVSGMVKDASILQLNQNVQTAGLLAEVTTSGTQRRMYAVKKVARKKLTSGLALSGKLADYATQDFSHTELFPVEGDSAGGSAKQVRDREYQAIMPLKGKILNTQEVSSDEVLASWEVHDISVAIDIDPDNNDLSQLRYDKICILADADSGGLHIATLLCALFVKHFRALVEHGYVYVALPSLYRIDLGKEVYYALTGGEKEGILEQLKRKKDKSSVQRFKGLREMNPIQLRETALDPNTRRLVQLTVDDGDDQRTDAMMDMLLAKKRSEDRRSWLQGEGDMAEVKV